MLIIHYKNYIIFKFCYFKKFVYIFITIFYYIINFIDFYLLIFVNIISILNILSQFTLYKRR